MTDAERKAHSLPRNWESDRCGHNYIIRKCPYESCDARDNAIALDEARAEIAQLRDMVDRMSALFGRKDLEIARLRGECDTLLFNGTKAREEVDRLCGPPAISAVERAQRVWSEIIQGMDGLMPIAKAIEQAQREAELAGFRRGRDAAATIAKKMRSEAELERHKTEDGEGKECWLWAFDTANAIERDIGALAPDSATPQSGWRRIESAPRDGVGGANAVADTASAAAKAAIKAAGYVIEPSKG